MTAETLKAAREASGLSLTDLQDASGVSRVTIHRAEHGLRLSKPTIDKLEAALKEALQLAEQRAVTAREQLTAA